MVSVSSRAVTNCNGEPKHLPERSTEVEALRATPWNPIINIANGVIGLEEDGASMLPGTTVSKDLDFSRELACPFLATTTAW
jgi:hypothetical protein